MIRTPPYDFLRMPAPGRFQVVSPFQPTGDQPGAIDAISRRIEAGEPHTVLLGATGTGKTFTMANVIERVQKPTLIISHNKTLAAQLYEEMREIFPRNAVAYFVSYYDYYQPEAYIPQRDIYIEKDSSRNDDLDRLRLAATSSLLSRRDTIVVASVSCIFGLGSPDAYRDRVFTVQRGQTVDRRELLLALVAMQYKRSDIEFQRGMYRVRGDVIELFPAYEQFAVRIEMFGDDIERIELINPTSGEVLAEESQFHIFPAVHHVTPEDEMERALSGIRAELDERLIQLRHEGKLLEAQRLQARTKYDLELLAEVGVCPGVENYSRWFDGRMPGEQPFCLLDYFERSPRREGSGWAGSPSRPFDATSGRAPHEEGAEGEPARRAGPPGDGAPGRTGRAGTHRDWLLIIDESHVTLPQVRAMYNGDQARKRVLVEHGFRLPSALDNRPLKFEEFEAITPQVVYVSATPGPYELQRTGGEVVEQVIRPTGLVDPVIEIRSARGQVPDLIEECSKVVATGERALVTALTKKLCEQLAQFLDDRGLRVRYLHSDIETLDRVEILRDLRLGEFDVLVGVNLLREGLDLPEVSLVCILDADKEGFLRSATSLIQQMGRAARNVNARAILYADKMTPAMQAAIEETERRRAKQEAYNREHDVTPQQIRKAIRRGIETELRARQTAREAVRASEELFDRDELLASLRHDMLEAAERMEFERAAELRDRAVAVKKLTSQPVAPEGVSPEMLGDAPPVKKTVRMSEVDRELYGEEGAKTIPGAPGSKVRKRKRMKGN